MTKPLCGQADCDCGHTIKKLSIELATIRWLAAAVVRGAKAGSGFRSEYLEHGACPHETIPYYPTHALWCDLCFGSLELAVSLPVMAWGDR